MSNMYWVDRLREYEARDYASHNGNGNGNGNGHGPKAATLRVLDTLTMTTTAPPPIDWMVDGVFARGKLTMFGGREKQGKSLVQLAISVKMASGGGEVAGISVKPGKVLLIDAENGEREIHRRLRSTGLQPEHAANLVAVEARGVDLRDDRKQLETLLDEHRPDLLLLDSFRALWRGDERDEAAVAAALDPLRGLVHDREIGASITHHAQKGGSEYRGSTAIGAAMDWAVMLSREREDPFGSVRRRLSNPMARFAPERSVRWLEIISTGGDDGAVQLAEAEPFIPPQRTTSRDEVADALKAHFRGVQGAGPFSGSCTLHPGFTLADLARAVGRKEKDGTVRNALKDLAKEGFVSCGEDKRWRPTSTLFDDEEGEE